VAAEEGAVMVWDCAKPSDQAAKTYCVPELPAMGEFVAMVWLVPGVHWKVQGEVQAAASTVSDWPVTGAVVMVKLGETMVVGSVAEFGADPPPDTPTVLVIDDGAFDATLTVTVIAG